MKYYIAFLTIILSTLAICCASSEMHDATSQGVRKAAIRIEGVYDPEESISVQKEGISMEGAHIPKGWIQQQENTPKPKLGDAREKKRKDKIINASQNKIPGYVLSAGRPVSESSNVVNVIETGIEDIEPLVEDIAVTMQSDIPSTMPSHVMTSNAPTAATRLNQVPISFPTMAPSIAALSDFPSDQPSLMPLFAAGSSIPSSSTAMPSFAPTAATRLNQVPISVPTMAPSLATPSDFPSDQPSIMSVSAAGSSIPSSSTAMASSAPTAATRLNQVPISFPTMAPSITAPSDFPSDQPSIISVSAAGSSIPSSSAAMASSAPTFAVRLNQVPISFPTMAPSIATRSDFPSDQPSLISVSAAGSSIPSSVTTLASAPSDSKLPLTSLKEQNTQDHHIEYCSGGTEAFESMEMDIIIPYTYNLNVASGTTTTTSAQVDQYVSSIEEKVHEALNQALCYTSSTDNYEQEEAGEPKRGRPRRRGYRVSAMGYSSYPTDKVEGACDDRGGRPNDDMCKKVVGAATLRIFQAKETAHAMGVDSFRCAALQNIYDLIQDNGWDGITGTIAYTEATTDFTCNAPAIELPTSSSSTTSSTSTSEAAFPLTATTIVVASAAAIAVSIVAIMYSKRLHRKKTTTCSDIVHNFSSRDSVGCSTIIAGNLSCSRSRDEVAEMNELDLPTSGSSGSNTGLSRHSSASRRIMHSHSDASRRTLQSRDSSRGWGGVGGGSGGSSTLGGSESNDRYTPQEQEARQQEKDQWCAAAAMAAAAAYRDEYDFDVDDGDYDDIPLSACSDSDIYTTPDRSSGIMSPSTRSDISWMCAALGGGGGASPYNQDFASPRV